MYKYGNGSARGEKMGNVAKLIIKKKEDNPEALKVFEETELPGEKDQVQEIIASYPTVYTHSWEDGALMRYI